MYFMRLLTTSVNNAKVVVQLGSDSYQKLGKRYNLNSCINKGRKEFKKVHFTNPAVVGYAIYRGPLNKPNLEFSYVIEEYEHLERDIMEA